MDRLHQDVRACKLHSIHRIQWGVIDKNLPMSAVDRLFIAVNVEIVDLEENQDRSLCRYEFFEILARMAFTKFMEKGPLKTVAEGLHKLLTEYIIENSIERIEFQEWRVSELWTLEVDDLLKANLKEIQKVRKHFTSLLLAFIVLKLLNLIRRFTNKLQADSSRLSMSK